jgi:hypothetical protein
MGIDSWLSHVMHPSELAGTIQDFENILLFIQSSPFFTKCNDDVIRYLVTLCRLKAAVQFHDDEFVIHFLKSESTSFLEPKGWNRDTDRDRDKIFIKHVYLHHSILLTAVYYNNRLYIERTIDATIHNCSLTDVSYNNSCGYKLHTIVADAIVIALFKKNMPLFRDLIAKVKYNSGALEILRLCPSALLTWIERYSSYDQTSNDRYYHPENELEVMLIGSCFKSCKTIKDSVKEFTSLSKEELIKYVKTGLKLFSCLNALDAPTDLLKLLISSMQYGLYDLALWLLDDSHIFFRFLIQGIFMHQNEQNLFLLALGIQNTSSRKTFFDYKKSSLLNTEILDTSRCNKYNSKLVRRLWYLFQTNRPDVFLPDPDDYSRSICKTTQFLTIPAERQNPPMNIRTIHKNVVNLNLHEFFKCLYLTKDEIDRIVFIFSGMTNMLEDHSHFFLYTDKRLLEAYHAINVFIAEDCASRLSPLHSISLKVRIYATIQQTLLSRGGGDGSICTPTSLKDCIGLQKFLLPYSFMRIVSD